jgi:GGDEF domain-containing protein
MLKRRSSSRPGEAMSGLQGGDPVPSAERARHGDLFDAETGMPGWALLLDRTNLALVRARRTRRSVAVLVIDSPRGVAGGSPDAVALAGALRSVLRPDDTVARVEANTYVAVCSDVCREEDAVRIGQRLLEQQPSFTCRMGIGVGAGDEPAEALLHRARETVMPVIS